MTPLAQHRLFVLNALQQGELKMADAARLLGVSVRQVRRLRAAYRRRGAVALVHGNRGRPSPRRVPDLIRARIQTLAKTTYAGANHVHLTELLTEREALAISRPTVRRILLSAGLRSPRTRRPPRHRTRRDRMPHPGMLVQLDGSHHDWLEDRGPKLVLHAAIDDATSTVLAGWFEEPETARGYLRVLCQVALGPGIPLAVYTDRHGIFKRTPTAQWTIDEQLRGRRAPTQVQRLLEELRIQWIPASTPQAKGRIERLFGALQDRLVTELRLAGIRDAAAANQFLPDFFRRYNARFAQTAAQLAPLYRPWPQAMNPETIFCFKYLRTVANDNTVAVGPHHLQLLPGPGGRSYAKVTVEVHERLDGSLAVFYRGTCIPSRRLTAAPSIDSIPARGHPRVHPDLAAGAQAHRSGGTAIATPSYKMRPGASGKATSTLNGARRAKGTLAWKPAPDHPWRRTRFGKAKYQTPGGGRTKSLNV